MNDSDSDSDSKQVRGELKSLGAPIHGPALPVADIEQALVNGIVQAHSDATLAKVLPLCLFQQREKIDLARLIDLAEKAGEVRALGFFLDMTTEVSGDKRFRVWSTGCVIPAGHDKEYFFTSTAKTDEGRKLAEMHTPELSKRWRLVVNMGLDAFQSCFSKFREVGRVY